MVGAWGFGGAQMKKGEGGVRIGEGRYQDLVCRKSLRIFLLAQIK